MFERSVDFLPAYDKGKEYGIGAMKVRFVLKGPKGAVQFLISTGWFLPHTQRKNREWQYDFDKRFNKINPEGYDLGYHSPVPMYEGQTAIGKCDVVGGECYYDGSTLNAEAWIEPFLNGGTEWLWPRMEQEYRQYFEGVEDAA